MKIMYKCNYNIGYSEAFIVGDFPIKYKHALCTVI